MKNIWKRIAADLRDYRIAILLILLWNIIIRKAFHAFCPFLILTGFPCAGCGMTRAVFHILTGSVRRGLALNPAAPFWIFWLAYFIGNRYVLGRSSKWALRLLGVVCVITFAIYLYRMITQFPGEPPMTYYRNNLIAKYRRFLEELLQKVR